MKAAEIRANWRAALLACADVREISGALKWGFTERDLQELRALYKAGTCKGRIMALLEDCNFHAEARALEAENE